MSDIVTTGETHSEAPAPQSAPGAPEPVVNVSVAVVEFDVATRERIMALLGDGVTPFTTLEELTSRLTGAMPVVAVLGPSCTSPETLSMIERVNYEYPYMASVLVVGELSTQLLQQALRAGVRDVLALTGEAGALAHAVQRVAVSLEVAPRPTTGQVTPPVDGEMPEPVNGKVYSVFSTKGGSGKSVLATSLAVSLAQRCEQPVCLVDADLQFGDVAVMLKLTPSHTIVDAVSVLDQMDAAMLDSLLVTHEPSGLRVMPAPLEPAFADQVGAHDMAAIVDVLRTFCAYVIVDTPAYFNDVVLGLVEASDEVLLVAGMDIPNIKNVKIGLQTLRLLDTPMEKLHLVLNRANSKVKLEVSEVEKTLGIKADALIPSDIAVPQSVNKGEPVVQYNAKSSVAKAIEELADKIQPRQQARKKR
ncbi:MAG: P-loop NTPase [Actinomycetia bacterium]|nr:P-loop NTPase [Actinomycetes bacterium]